jgi:hypothetical protein
MRHHFVAAVSKVDNTILYWIDSEYIMEPEHSSCIPKALQPHQRPQTPLNEPTQ